MVAQERPCHSHSSVACYDIMVVCEGCCIACLSIFRHDESLSRLRQHIVGRIFLYQSVWIINAGCAVIVEHCEIDRFTYFEVVIGTIRHAHCVCKRIFAAGVCIFPGIGIELVLVSYLRHISKFHGARSCTM